MKNARGQKLILLALVFSLAAGIAGCGEPGVTASDTPPSEIVATPAPPSPTPEPTAGPSPTPAAATPDVTFSKDPDPAETDPLPVKAGPEVPRQEATDNSFFADAAFLGNSLVRGLLLYGDIDTADYYAANSASVWNVGMTLSYDLGNGVSITLLDAISRKAYNKVYVLMGINEISLDTDYFISLYSDMLDTIRQSQPEADIYIMSLTPVTEEKSNEGPTFSAQRVSEYNEALYGLAGEKDCYYIDLVDALAEPDGYLDPELSTDGIHMKRPKYTQWSDYLRTHYIPAD